MRLFGKMSHFLHISRCLSYHAPICRPHRLLHGSCKQWKKICSQSVHWQPPQLLEMSPTMPTMIQVQFYSQRNANNVFTLNSNTDMRRKRISFSGTPGDSNAKLPKNVVPVGIIMPDTNSKDNKGQQLKIVIVPLDFANQDGEYLKNTLEAINHLRTHASEIEAFANNMIKDCQAEASDATNSVTDEMHAVAFWENTRTQNVDAVSNAAAASGSSGASGQELRSAAVAALNPNADVAMPTPGMPNSPSTMPINPGGVPLTTPQTQPNVLPLGDPKETQISAYEYKMDQDQDTRVQQIVFDVPHNLGNRLNEMAIASMDLSFEMDMTNVRDAILYGEDAAKPEPTLGNDATVLLETKVEMDPINEPTCTVPLQFNALIKGTVKLDAEKLNPDKLTDEHLPEYNDTVTCIAATICSTALQEGFVPNAANRQPQGFDMSAKDPKAQTAGEIDVTNQSSGKVSAQARMALKRHQAQKHMKIEHRRPMGSVPMPEEKVIRAPYLKDGCKYPIVKPKKKCPKPCKLDDPCKEDPCKNPPRRKGTKKRAAKTTQITASGKKDSGAKGDKKKDPCAKKGGDKKKDPCAKKGGDKGKKEDPCAKFKKDKDKKKDPCAKKGGDKGKKEDPCAKFKKDKDKKKDPCAKKGGDKKKDPCAKKGGDKKKDPCAKKGGDKKKDPCAKKGGDKKKDPCAKKGGDKKKDPCAKFKKDKDKKKDPCASKKKDPCASKKKEDPCASKKKKDPCASKKKEDPCAKKDKCALKPCEKKDDGKKADPCAQFKKGGASKDDKGKKKFSTFASPVSKYYHTNASVVPTKRRLSTSNGAEYLATGLQTVKERLQLAHRLRPCFLYSSQVRRNFSVELAQKTVSCKTPKAARFAVYSTLVRRHYSGLPSKTQMSAWGIKTSSPLMSHSRDYGKRGRSKKSKKGKKESGKCAALGVKYPKHRKKPVKARTGLRDDCFKDDGEDQCAKKIVKKECSVVKFPRKKCARDNKKPKPVRYTPPKKKLPAICSVGKKGKKDKGRKK